MRFVLLFGLFFWLAAPALSQSVKDADPDYWNGKLPSEQHGSTGKSLMSHAYFYNMTRFKQNYSVKQMKQKPGWLKRSTRTGMYPLLDIGYRTPWHFMALEGCNFDTPAEQVQATFFHDLEKRHVTQDYILFVGNNCQMTEAEDFGAQRVTFMMPSKNYDTDDRPLDTSVYSCAEMDNANNVLYGAFTITYEYYPRQRKYYYIGADKNLREKRLSKTPAQLACTGTSKNDVAQHLLDQSYRTVVTKPEIVEPIAASSLVCRWEKNEICPANGGPCIYDNIRVCD